MAEVFQRKIKPNIDFSDVAPIDSANTLANGLANTLANTLANGLANGSNSEKPELDSKNTKKTGDNNNNNNNNNNISAEQSSAKKKSSKKFSPSPSLIRKKVLIEKADAAAAQNSPVRVQNIENGVDGLEGTENLTYPKNFNKSEAINKMLSPYKKNGKEIKPQRHVSIVGLFILAKDMEITSEDQIKSIIKRNIRAASDLKPYSFKKIIKTMKYLKENADFKWTLESVSKFIDEDLEKINKSPGKILGEDVKIKD
jgi:hypothetical protein